MLPGLISNDQANQPVIKKNMNTHSKWPQYLSVAGITLLLLGVIDPMEGSVVILAGSLLYTISAFIKSNSQRYWLLGSLAMIAAGVFFLFYFSSLGGIGGNSAYSYWWGLLILLYPIGWVITIILIITSVFQKRKLQN